ncbi:hypothetical protein ACFYWX_46235 [Streptomyces sp. NPDC002888]|uniref:hypothetical protein n=1 Tax=Streptomyces sp. NPDC002888 TaxID=3364668 RepID=UPI0036856851
MNGRLVADILAVGAGYSLALSGRCGVWAHGLVRRVGEGVEVATDSAVGMGDVVEAVRGGLSGLGWVVRVVGVEPLAGRLVVSEPTTGEAWEVDVLKEVLWRAPVQTENGLAVALEDLVGIRVRDLVDGGLARELVDVRAGAEYWTRPELEELGRRHARDVFELADLQSRLAAVEWIDDREFAALGLEEPDIVALRRWAQEWADDIAERLVEGEAPPQDE